MHLSFCRGPAREGPREGITGDWRQEEEKPIGYFLLTDSSALRWGGAQFPAFATYWTIHFQEWTPEFPGLFSKL